jgi:hypothetical protein
LLSERKKEKEEKKEEGKSSKSSGESKFKEKGKHINLFKVD